ncbi:FRG domain-containing protein [Candidatus Berkiella aquae]|uniref:FRG domain protein n=1 Tax=Candidatus Berkiella aquae TaxID=295108 RepID=A0A0Q9YEJ8_9GAMM|nr:FRG domain-containing protein [Candidatus Berkiella aquae]MCS5711648.1 FRG domain-containing protein [Candidatus Berkiella aquae]
MNSVQEINVDKAEEFWDILSPTKPMFPEPYNLIYRGQRDAGWPLEPSVFREHNNPIIEFNSKIPTAYQQISSELDSFRKFLEYCDKIGIPLPGDSHQFREIHFNSSRMLNNYLHNAYLWPHPDLYELMAIAQHYGLPTKLLDWSKYSYVAIYFAASDAIDNINKITSPGNFDELKKKRLAVWILNIENKIHFPALEIVRVPSGYNKNIANQEGCFTLLRQSAEVNKPFNGSRFHDEFPRMLPDNYIKKVTVPVMEAVKLLELCESHFISASTLFRDFQGAARAVKDDLNKSKFLQLMKPDANMVNKILMPQEA